MAVRICTAIIEELNMFKILIAEDDINLNRLLDKNLTERGYSVISANNGKQAKDCFDLHSPDLLITDILMPDMDGFVLVKQIKNERPDFPVIMLTALDTFEDKKLSFELGADDYISKPVNFDELALRINALLRRYKLVTLRDITHKELRLNYVAKCLTINNNPVDLTKKEFLLLYMLLSTPGRIYSRTQILDEIWGYDSDSQERTVDVHINKLRERLQNQSVEIVTVRGLGYKAVLI